MFLKKIELFGFKSFADRVSLEFSDGITSLLGPNGCGKSNIVDSIKWVLGEQSIKTLRAGQMEDVIFNGTETRNPLNVAEVILTVANDSGTLPLDLPEIEIRRRIFRGGENEYSINNTPVRLREIRELFYDTGIGKSAYSILEQGKIDQILSQRPEDRRYIFEEAAGITRYKQKSAEAERKLKKTDENITQVEQVLSEVRRTYESRKSQAEKARRSRALQEQIFDLEVKVQLFRVHELMNSYSAKMEEISRIEDECRSVRDEIDRQNEEMEESLDLINSLSRTRIEMQTRIHRLDEVRNSKENQKSLLLDRLEDFQKAVHESADRGAGLSSRIERDRQEIAAKETARRELTAEVDQIDREIRSFKTHVESAEERIEENETRIRTEEQRIVGEEERQAVLREELRELTDAVVLELDKKLKESGYTYRKRREIEHELQELSQSLFMRLSGKAALAAEYLNTSGVSASSRDEFYRELTAAVEQMVGDVLRLDELFDQYRTMIPAFLDEFLAPEGVITRKRENDDALAGSLRSVRTMQEQIRTLRDENRHLSGKLSEYRRTLENLKISQADMLSRAEGLHTVMVNLQRSVQEQELLLEDSSRDIEVTQERIEETRERIRKTEDEQQALGQEIEQLQYDMRAVMADIEAHNDAVRQQREQVNGKLSRLSSLTSSAERLRAEREAVEHELAFVYDTFEDTYSKSLKEYSSGSFTVPEDLQQLREELKEAKQTFSNLGYINYMAVEEFEEVRERYEFMTRQLEDLEKAKTDLQKITLEIKTKSEQLFSACYEQLKTCFHTMFRRLFGGGRAELKLVNPDDLLNSGIDILAQPPGKKLEKISLLSGGERSLTAVALLFATYMVKPSPFCVLDEIDAALDDANISHFLNVLQEFSRSSQFIIITHNKKTVMGSSTLLGVTMEEPGVSKAVSYRIQDMENEPSNHLTG
jgi:chromosome segregation protein